MIWNHEPAKMVKKLKNFRYHERSWNEILWYPRVVRYYFAHVLNLAQMGEVQFESRPFHPLLAPSLTGLFTGETPETFKNPPVIENINFDLYLSVIVHNENLEKNLASE